MQYVVAKPKARIFICGICLGHVMDDDYDTMISKAYMIMILEIFCTGLSFLYGLSFEAALV
jgi:hypothetical protein